MKALIDLHTHTLVSGHAYSTIKENVEAAKLAGLKYIGLSEHAPNMPAAARVASCSHTDEPEDRKLEETSQGTALEAHQAAISIY